MKKYNMIGLFLILLQFVVVAKQQKVVFKEFNIDSEQKLILKTKGGMDVDVVAWDEPIIKFDLKISISSSDEDYEKAFIEEFNITSSYYDDILEIEIDFPSKSEYESFWDIFKFGFRSYVDQSIEGKIYLPKMNAVLANFNYGNISLKNMEGELNIKGRSNSIQLEDCKNIGRIENFYGEISILRSGGNLDILNRSSKIDIEDFAGSVKLDAQYCNFNLKNIGGTVDIASRSSDEIKITNVDGNCEVNSDFSNIIISEVKGFVGVKNRSGNVSITSAQSFSIIAPYTNCIVKDIDGKNEQEVYKCSLRSGSFRGENIKGDITIRDFFSSFDFYNITGNIDLTSRSGKIEGEKIIGKWKSETEYCKIKLHEMTSSSIEIKNRSEPVTLEVVSIPESIIIKNEFGSVKLGLPAGFEGEYELVSTQGGIESNIPLKIQSKGSLTFSRGSIGKGNRHIFIENRSDDIIIEETKLVKK